MKKIVKLSLICFLVISMCFVIGACKKDDPHTELTVNKEFSHEDGVFKTVVPKSVEKYDILSKITIHEKANLVISKTNTFESILDGSNLSLEFGDNIFYVKISAEKLEDQVYKFNIFRNSLLTVYFETDGGTPVENISVENGALLEAPKSVKTGYTLQWNYDFTQPITEDMIIKALWIPNNYKITISNDSSNAEDIVLDITFASEYDLSDLVTPKSGYRLIKFYYYINDHEFDFEIQGVYKNASDVTLYAVYEPIKYSITYMFEKGASNLNTINKFTVEDLITLKDAEWKNEEKEFDGWYTSNDYNEESKINKIEKLSNDITLWAKFIPKIFTTKVSCYVGNNIASEYEFTYNSQYTIDNPNSPKGYKFDGWCLGNDLIASSGTWSIKDETLKLNASFSPVTYTIIYKLPNGAVNLENPSEYNVKMGEVELKTPTYGNHIFEGWYLDYTLKNKVEKLSVDNVTSNITLYPKWKYVTSVKLDTNGADYSETQLTFNFGNEYTLPELNKAGYKFLGWYLNDLKIERNDVWPYKDAEVELNAQFELVEYNIKYDLPDGASNGENSGTYNAEMGTVELKEPTFGHHEFMGWYLDSEFKNEITEIKISDVSNDLTLYSKWQYVTKVELDASGAACAETNLTLYFGKSYTLPSNLSKKGFKFIGWYYGETKIETDTWIYKDSKMVLIAKFEARNYDIEYDLPEGAENNKDNINTYTVEMGNVELKKPSFKNHIFEGWYLDSNYTIPITQITKENFTEEMTIYSKWQYVTNVKLDTAGADCAETELTFNFGKDYILPELNKAGYEFIGWYLDDVKIERMDVWQYKDDEIKLNAQFKLIDYSIKYSVPDGAVNDENDNTYNVEMGTVVLKEPVFGHHEFLGWYSDSSFENKITELKLSDVINGITLYSKWQYVTKVTLNAKEGSCDINDIALYYGKEYSLPVAKRLGYTFVGWFLDENTEIELVDVWINKSDSLEFYAKYVLNQNEINYDLPSGATNNNANVGIYTVEMDKVELKNPTFGRHEFLGWYLDPNYENKITELTVYNVVNGMTVYSKWQYVSNVQFDIDGGNDPINDKLYYYGQSYELPTPIKAGCLFEGWYLGDEKITSATWEFKEDVILTANWVPTTIAINYVLNGGVQNPDNPETFDVFTGIIKLKNPTISNGLLFSGWYRDANFTTKVTQIDTAVDREITLYAKWIGTDITIVYDSNSGYVAITEQSVIHGTAYSLLPAERPGYKFIGWHYEGELIPMVGTWTIASDRVNLVAQWEIIKYNIAYDLDDCVESDVYTIQTNSNGEQIKVPVQFVKEYDVNSNVTIPQIFRDGYIFLGWQTNNGLVQELTIGNGNVGNRTYAASWIVDTDEFGFTYAIDKNQQIIVVGFMKDPKDDRKVEMPSEYGGLPVKVIATNAFTAFGEKYGSTLKTKDYYYTIVIPKSISEIQNNAFDGCNGICVSLRDDSGTILDFKSEDELKEWEKGVSYATGKNVRQVRDCIWGFRPAIGWTRFSAVKIPDDYE